jgi:hypothetical protein
MASRRDAYSGRFLSRQEIQRRSAQAMADYRRAIEAIPYRAFDAEWAREDAVALTDYRCRWCGRSFAGDSPAWLTDCPDSIRTFDAYHESEG